MKKMFRKYVCFGLVLCMMLSSMVTVNAQTVKCTKNMKKTVELIGNYLSLNELSENEKKYNVRLTTKEKYRIIALGRQFYGYSEKQLVENCKQIFGTSKKIDFMNAEDCYIEMTLNDNGKVVYYAKVGDWGEDIPERKITKVEKISNGVYDVTIKLYIGNFNDPSVHDYHGKSVVRIKKSKAGKYGYIIKKITLYR